MDETARWRTRTVFLLSMAVPIFLAYDVVAYRYGGQDATITQVLRDNSADWLMIPLLAGIVLGHVFWSYRGEATP